jgi:hypothetical protein
MIKSVDASLIHSHAVLRRLDFSEISPVVRVLPYLKVTVTSSSRKTMAKLQRKEQRKGQKNKASGIVDEDMALLQVSWSSVCVHQRVSCVHDNRASEQYRAVQIRFSWICMMRPKKIVIAIDLALDMRLSLLRKILIPIASESTASVPTIQRYCTDESATFYNSQAGRWMLKPGALGLRVHELYSLVSGMPGLLAMLPARLSSHQCSLAMLGDFKSSKAVGEGSGTLHVVVPVKVPDDIHAAVRAANEVNGQRGTSPIVVQPQVTLCLGPDSDEIELSAAADLVQQCARAGLPARALLTRAWARASDDPDENAHQGSAVEAALAFADAEAGVIALSDCLGSATEDSLRDAVEAIFNIDCSGESMMERLALRLGEADLCGAAMRLGVTRFDASACPNLVAAGRGAVRLCKSREARGREGSGGCACSSKGIDCVVGLETLMAVAEARGIKHRIKVDSFKSVRMNLERLFR